MHFILEISEMKCQADLFCFHLFANGAYMSYNRSWVNRLYNALLYQGYYVSMVSNWIFDKWLSLVFIYNLTATLIQQWNLKKTLVRTMRF